MHHHKSLFSRKKTGEGHGKKVHRHSSHGCGHHKGSSRKKGYCKHFRNDFTYSEYGLSGNRKVLFHRLENDASLLSDQSIDNISIHDSGLKLNVDLDRCVRCGKCERVCPSGAIMVDEDIFRVDSSLCDKCGCCIDGCREVALSLRENQEVFMN
jgi:ferredoxin